MGFDFVVMFIASLLDDILYGRYAQIGVECCIGDISFVGFACAAP
jgi:hypothetical protein